MERLQPSYRQTGYQFIIEQSANELILNGELYTHYRCYNDDVPELLQIPLIVNPVTNSPDNGGKDHRQNNMHRDGI